MSKENKKKYAYVLIPETGMPEIVFKDEAAFTLDELYKAIDCNTVEIIYPQNTEQESLILIVDENGKLRKKEYNPLASWLFGMEPFDHVVGKAIVAMNECEGFEEPDLFAIPSEIAEKIYNSALDIIA